jgi:hypothetical protein
MRILIGVILAAGIVGCHRHGMVDRVAPKDAKAERIVLFDGKDTSAWQHADGTPCKWPIVDDGAMQVKGGDIFTKQTFGDCKVHVEFWIPKLPPDVKGQARGNSGVYLMGRYEVQVLDSYGLKSGVQDCGAIYGQKAPDVNACLPPEQWQMYDIDFTAPRFDDKGNKIAKPRITVRQNGQLIQNDVEIDKPTKAGFVDEPPGPGPLRLQDHGNAVRYRNIYIIEKK